jgi:hypothetical protein
VWCPARPAASFPNTNPPKECRSGVLSVLEMLGSLSSNVDAGAPGINFVRYGTRGAYDSLYLPPSFWAAIQANAPASPPLMAGMRSSQKCSGVPPQISPTPSLYLALRPANHHPIPEFLFTHPCKPCVCKYHDYPSPKVGEIPGPTAALFPGSFLIYSFIPPFYLAEFSVFSFPNRTIVY